KNWWAKRKSIGMPRLGLTVPATLMAAVIAMGIPAAWNDSLGQEETPGSQQMGLKNWWAKRKSIGMPRLGLTVPATLMAAVIAMGI
ncbi:hypothetical protein HT105_24830, partial [Bacteroides fragilis]|nr:hypothetical protein [Bacteroides fragilis]